MTPTAISPSGSYGWRARIGMIVPPQVIDTNSHEFYLMAPEGVELFVTPIGLAQERSQREYDRVMASIDGPIQSLLQFSPDAIVQAGVPPIVTRGWGFEEEVQAQIAKLTEVPFFTDVGASLLALSALSCQRVVVVSEKFSGEVGEQIAAYLGHAGVEVVGSAQVENESSIPAPLLSLEQVYRTARRAYQMHRDSADAVWITQANMPSVGVIERLEADLSCSVVSSAQAIAWAGLRAAGVRDSVEGFGQLMRISDLPR